MLRELRIKNLVLADSLEIEFAPGLNIITGETGSGKSVILEAIALLLGERASSDLIRTGCDEAEIQGLIENANCVPLEQSGIDASGDIVVRRVISASGRNRIYINGTLSSLKTLSEFGESTADMHGQFEHQSLLSERNQLDLLDRCAGAKALELKASVSSCHARMKELSERLERIDSLARERARRLDMLRFQTVEISDVCLEPGEEEALESEKLKLANIEKLQRHSAEAHELLSVAERSALDTLSGAMSALSEIARYDESALGAVDSLREAIANAREAAAFARSYNDSLEAEPGRLDQVIGRLEVIARLKRKYGSSVDEVLDYLRRAEDELNEMEHSDSRRAELQAEFETCRADYNSAAAELGRIRRETATRMSASIETELRLLAMPDAKFSVLVEDAEPGPDGSDRVSFMLSPNPGTPMKPVARTASGGELSRVMLAIKSVTGNTTPILVFDEIDAGIGGRTAEDVGRRLKGLAARQQVICVTHLPQIAAYADRHIVIDKLSADGATTIEARITENGERVRELARMLSGSETDTSLRHAEELIGKGNAWLAQ
ncbi:MAG: DNA repair protein RecN [Nitrospirae bacterium]|nr:DNA repair protein RecN [Nitrospirota bacterium]